MMSDIPYAFKADVAGFTVLELAAVADLVGTPGWAAVQKLIEALMEPVRPAVYANTDPEKQFLLHQGLGAIYVAANLTQFVSSARSQADRLVQQAESAGERAEQSGEDEV